MHPPKALGLSGIQVLVVEDEAAISLLLEDMLTELGCAVVGPVGRVATALAHAETDRLDLAILDVNVAGQPVYPVVEALIRRGVPFVFSTGYGVAGIDEPYRGRPVLQKPFSQRDLDSKVRVALGLG